MTNKHKQFNEDQMREIRLGLEKRLDVSVYGKPEFDYVEMFEIRSVLERGFDFSVYEETDLFKKTIGLNILLFFYIIFYN